MNINKYIASSGLTSRRGADEIIKEGRVKINGRVATPIDKVGEYDQVFVDGKIIKLVEEKVYLVFNKPVGIITTTDKRADDNIISYIHYRTRIFPVGRLDVNSSGLILLTNDGEIVNKILKGRGKIEKEYIVEVYRTITNDLIVGLEAGIILDGFKTLPAKVKKISDKTMSITIVEGKNRQIRRMCELLGNPVVKLKRVRIGNLKLANLKEGEYVEIPADKIYELIGIEK